MVLKQRDKSYIYFFKVHELVAAVSESMVMLFKTVLNGEGSCGHKCQMCELIAV